MNYYKRHLGDFGKSLSNLSQGQVGAYDLLLDWHYANERPLPLDREELYNIGRCRTRAERDNVDRVLRYFDETPDGYVQKRALEEMERAARKGEHNRIVGRLGGRPKKDADGNPDANPEETQTVSKPNPDITLATSHKPLANKEQKSRTRGKAKACTLTDWIAELGDNDAVPADDPIFDWAAKVGIPRDWIALAWWVFEGRYTGDGQGRAKTYADWRATFRNAVREDWLRIWKANSSGAYSLTTAGQTAQRERQP